MILILDDKRLLSTAIAGAAIYISGILKNGGVQLGLEKHFISDIFGKALFVAGWLLMGFSIAGLPKLSVKAGLVYIGILGIVGSTFAVENGIIPKEAAIVLSILGLLSVAIGTGIDKENMSKYLAAFALVNILVSTLYVLPEQRHLNIVDGPGNGMILLGFLSLSLANSLDV